jgi:predicted Zn-dependent protease
MFLRASVSLLLFLNFSIACAAQSSSHRSAFVTNGSISGAVRTVDDHAVPNARVELRSVINGPIVQAGYTSFNGSFEFQSVPGGSYEVMVTDGFSQTIERVQLQSDVATLTLRVPARGGAASTAGDRNTVSVAQMKVSGKARDLMRKAQKAMAKHDFAESLAQVQKALEICPDFAEALTLRALLKLDANKVADALPDLEYAVQVDRGYATAFLVLGAAYNMVARFDDAIRIVDRGVSLSPNSWQGYFELGKAYIGKLNYDAALGQLNKAADLAPKEYAPLHLARANVYLAMKNYPAGIVEIEKFLQTDPQGPDSARARQALEKVRAFVAQK